MEQPVSSSAILEAIIGPSGKYRDILRPYIDKLNRDYPNANLQGRFISLSTKIISMGTLALCDKLLQDLNCQAEPRDLAALGLHMLPISTHDDVVDELPRDRTSVASLVFAGNIASGEGSRLLLAQGKIRAADVLLEAVNRNHYYQQQNVETLWTKPPATFAEYRTGIHHTTTLMRVGLEYGIALANRDDLRDTVIDYAYGYGIAIQLIDDIQEVAEDEVNGYWSYPLVEGTPYTESFRQLYSHIQMGHQAIPREWVNLHGGLDRLETIAKRIQQ